MNSEYLVAKDRQFEYLTVLHTQPMMKNPVAQEWVEPTDFIHYFLWEDLGVGWPDSLLEDRLRINDR